MTTAELTALIQGDATALQLAQAGSDDACASRCREIADPVPYQRFITELTILSLYDDPTAAEAVMVKIETVAQSNPVVARVLKWLQPSAPGIDAGDARVRTLLTASTAQGGIGLTTEQAQPILDCAAQQQNITGRDVAACGLFNPGA